MNINNFGFSLKIENITAFIVLAYFFLGRFQCVYARSYPTLSPYHVLMCVRHPPHADPNLQFYTLARNSLLVIFVFCIGYFCVGENTFHSICIL